MPPPTTWLPVEGPPPLLLPLAHAAVAVAPEEEVVFSTLEVEGMPRLPPPPPPPFEADLHMEAVVIVVAAPGVPHGGVLGVRGVRAVSLRLERLESCKIQEEKQKYNQYRNVKGFSLPGFLQ